MGFLAMMWDSSAAFMASCNMVWMPMMPDPGVIFATESGGVVVLTKATPGYAGGQKELIARGGVDKKKSPS